MRCLVLGGVALGLVVWVALFASTAFTDWRREWVVIGLGIAAAASVVAAIMQTFVAWAERPASSLGPGGGLARAADAPGSSESRFRDLAEVSSEWFWEQNEELRYTWFSDTVDRPGLTFDLIGLTRWEMVSEGVTDEQWAEHKALLAARLPFKDFRYIRTGDDGEVHHISVSGKPIFDANGRFCGYRGAGREVTAEVRAAEALLRANAEAEAARGEAERSRRLAEETNRHLLEAQRIGKLGHWFTDEVARTVTWSPQMFEITGLPPKPVMPLDLSRVPPIHPDDAAGFFAVRERAIATGETLMAEVRYVRPDGEVRWVHVEMKAHYDEACRPISLFGTTQDITERRQAEDELKAARERLLDAIDSISEGFALFDRDDRYVLTNSNYRRLYPDNVDMFAPGTRYEDMLRRRAALGIDLDGEDPEAWVERMLQKHRDCGEPGERRLPDGRWIRLVERRTSDGGIVAIRTDITAIKAAEGALRRQVRDLEAARVEQEKLSSDLAQMAAELATARDAAETRAAALARSEVRFRDFALTSSNWLWETDERHRFSYVSEGVQSFGWAIESLIGRTRIDIAIDAGSDPEKWQEHHATLDRHEPFREFIFTWRNTAGSEGVASISGDPVFNAKGRFVGYRGTGRDITKQVLAEAALREAKRAAEAASLAKSQFLANMSHELRTPLNAIIGFSEMIELEMKGALSPGYREYGRLIHQSGEHLHQVINDILDLAKVDAGKFQLREEEGIDPRRIVEACVTLVRGHADAGDIRLKTEISDGLPLVVADPTRLKQILLNLLSNAIKFTDAGGSVAIAARRAANGVEFEVRDTGWGMTPAELQIALEPFGQIDPGYARVREGTGLGLPLARRLAELHGGSLAVESEKGRGTTVTVTLPAPPAATSPAENTGKMVCAGA